jgi:hypothetical protein
LAAKGKWMGSEDYGAGNVPGDENSSLAARRARLRGTLSKQAVPPDPYTPDPYMLASQQAQQTPSNGAGQTEHEEPENKSNGAGASSAPAAQTVAPNMVAHQGDDMATNVQVQDDATETADAAEPARADRRKQPQVPSTMPPGVMQNLSNAISGSAAPYDYSAATADPISPDAAADNMSQSSSSYSGHALAPPVAPPLTQAVMPPSPFAPLSAPITPGTNGQDDNVSAFQPGQAIPAQTLMPETTRSDMSVVSMPDPGNSSYVFGIQPPSPPPPVAMSTVQPETPAIQSQAFEVLTNIDQAMGACAMNLSELQKIAGEQTEALRALAQTLQNQSFFEIGLNLNSLMESLSAALEPMKAVGELVPAIDQLVTVIEARETAAAEQPQQLTREQLVTSLADQLSGGIIDPWTFKCAYVAVYPSDHPADLLHRLVDLLGTQRLSGELFRAAYDAVQAAEPTRPDVEGGQTIVKEVIKEVVKVVQDETLLAQIEALQNSNEEFRLQQNDVRKMVTEKENEFSQHMARKEKELQEAQELLNSRYEEFNSRYDQLTETLHKRDEALQEKEADVSRKESENNQLRSQIQELRDQMREMAELLSSRPTVEPPAPPQPQQAPLAPAKASGFFDAAPQLPAPQQQPQNVFDPSRPPQPPMNPMDQLQQNLPQPNMQQQQMMQPQPQQPQPQPMQAPTNQAVPKPPAPTTPFAGSAGSYGSGVRAQVFEVIVRQALAGAPWREICAGPMQVNNISPEEVEAEVKRRQAMLKK